MNNQFEYTGKPKKIMPQAAHSLNEMNPEDKIRLDKSNLKDMMTRETVFAAAIGAPFGVPGIVAGTALGYIDSETKRRQKLKDYEGEQSEMGAAINEAMREL
jgi:hypothetical protein